MSIGGLRLSAKLIAVVGFGTAFAGAYLPWAEGIDSTWDAFGRGRFWLEIEWDVRSADGLAVVALASAGAIAALVTLVRRLDYWPITLVIALALAGLSLAEVDHVRDRGDDVLVGLQLVRDGAALAALASLTDGFLHLASRPARRARAQPAKDVPHR